MGNGRGIGEFAFFSVLSFEPKAPWQLKMSEVPRKSNPNNEKKQSKRAISNQDTAGASRRYQHPERMEITQPRVARNELPWDNSSNVPTLKGLHQCLSTRLVVRAGCDRTPPNEQTTYAVASLGCARLSPRRPGSAPN